MKTFLSFVACLTTASVMLWAGTYATNPVRTRLELGPPGFGFMRLYLAHILLTLPLAFALVRRGQRRWQMLTGLTGRLGCGVCGVLVLVLWPSLLDAFAAIVHAAEAHTLVSTAGRTILVLIILVPLLASFPLPAGQRAHERFLLLVLTLVSIGPPYLYARRLATTHTPRMEQLLETGRWVAAREWGQALADVGVSYEYQGRAWPALAKKIDHQISALERHFRLVGRAKPTAAGQMERAYQLLQLEQLDAAETLLKGLPTQPQSALLLGSLYRELRRWTDALAIYRTIQPTATDVWGFVYYQALGDVLRHMEQYDEAAEVYQTAINEKPKEAGYFYLQLGLLCADRQQITAAINHLERATQLQPDLATQTAGPLRSLRTSTYNCLQLPRRGTD